MKKITVQYDDSNEKILVTRDFLAAFFRVTPQAVTMWNKKGIEKVGKYYDLHYAIEWYNSNIDKSKSMVSRKQLPANYDVDSFDEFLSTLPGELALAFKDSNKDALDKFKDLKDIEKKDIDNKIKLGAYIPSNKLDIGMAELASIMVGLYRQDLHAFPSDLEKKTKKYIEEYLNTEYKKRLSDLHKISGLKSNKKIWDILEKISGVLTTKTADAILEKIGEL